VNLQEFIDSNQRNLYIEDCGLSYYVRKSLFFDGLIELANCSAIPGSDGLSTWRFLKRYEASIPFIAEQVLNPDLAKLYERRKWYCWNIGGIPQYASPLAVERYGEQDRFKMLCRDR
jgi:hypothetical protein